MISFFSSRVGVFIIIASAIKVVDTDRVGGYSGGNLKRRKS